MTQESLEKICARCKASTPGPWVLDSSGYIDSLKILSPWLEEAWEGDEEALRNMEFIAAAKQDIPALLDELAPLRARDTLRQVILETLCPDELPCPACKADLMGCVESDYADGICFCPYCGQRICFDVREATRP